MSEKTVESMEITLPLVESILKTLPISYYAGRDIKVTLDPLKENTYYNVYEDSIVISFPRILEMIKGLKRVDMTENILRGLLYHEVSHAILTPERWAEYLGRIGTTDKQTNARVMNIFEDERIETILKNHYYGVDFKKNVILLNNYQGEPPQDAMSAFYHIVRFRTDYVPGREEFLKRTADIINVYRKITRDNEYDFDDYTRDVGNLFWDIAKDWLEKNDKKSLEEAMGGKQGEDGSTPKYDGASEAQKAKAVKDVINKQAQEGKFGDGPAVSIGIGKPGDLGKGGKKVVITNMPPMHGKSGGEDDDPEGEVEKITLTDEQLEELMKAIERAEEETDPEYDKYNDMDSVEKKEKVQKMLKTMANRFVDQGLTDRISEIFENFLSRHKNNSTAMMRYSGVMDPRLIGTRKDWRIWNYKATDGPIKGYDTLHLNLFIDTSGSYYNNEEKTNTILKSLDTLEKKYPFFSFDLVTCQEGEKLRTKEERYIQANGGNNLDKNIWKIYKDLQNPRSFNYNIILFDGDAFTDCSYSQRDANKKNFGAFNSSKCSIISDDDNEKAIEMYAPQAHRVIVDGRHSRKSYSELLFENVLEALNRALL